MNSKTFVTIHDDEKYFGHWNKNSFLAYAMRIVPALSIRSYSSINIVRSPGDEFFFPRTELIPGRRRASPKNIHSSVASHRTLLSSSSLFEPEYSSRAPVIEQWYFPPAILYSNLIFNTITSPSVFILWSVIFLTRWRYLEYLHNCYQHNVSFYGYFNRRYRFSASHTAAKWNRK